MTMSRDAVAELVHRYADAVVRRDGEQWGRCWADDAHWSLGPGRAVVGREAIVSLWMAAMAGFEAVIQNVYNGEVRFDGERGEGRWYIGEHWKRVGGETGILLAHYDDTYVRVGGEWLFADRQLAVHYRGPADLSGTFLNALSGSGT
jgi:hypothetical protein